MRCREIILPAMIMIKNGIKLGNFTSDLLIPVAKTYLKIIKIERF